MKMYNASNWNRAFAQFVQSQKKGLHVLHELSVSALMLADPTREEGDGNVDRIRKIAINVRNELSPMRFKQYVLWATTFAPIVITATKDDVEVKFLRKSKRAEHLGFNVPGAIDQYPFDLDVGDSRQDPKPWSFDEAARRLVTRAQKEGLAPEAIQAGLNQALGAVFRVQLEDEEEGERQAA